jgi:hypothetical protein
MARFMPQDLFDNLAITYLMCSTAQARRFFIRPRRFAENLTLHARFPLVGCAALFNHFAERGIGMISEEDFAAAVADQNPAMAFVRLERRFRTVLQTNLENSQSSGASNSYIIEYMNHTVATAKALELEQFAEWPLPNEDDRDIGADYRRFTTTIDHYAVQIQIANVRNPPTDSVGLELSEKRIIRHYVEQIKAVIESSQAVITKRERLLDALNAFLAEVDQPRTPLKRFSDVVTTLAHLGGDAADALEPAWKWVKLIGGVLGARQESEQLRLPKPTPQKKLEGPKRKLPAPSASPKKKDDFDEEIPF